MKFLLSTAALALILLDLSPVRIAAQGVTASQNPQVEIAYRPPQKREYQPIYNRLKDRRVLEELRQFLTPLRLPKKLTIQIDQCGTQRRPYKMDGVATICYELIEQIEKVATRLSADSRALGGRRCVRPGDDV